MARAVTIHAALELGRRMAGEERQDGAPIRSPRDVVELSRRGMEDLPVEEFHVAVLDAQHRLERDITVTRGILNSSLVHPREVFREAIAERRRRSFSCTTIRAAIRRHRRTIGR